MSHYPRRSSYTPGTYLPFSSSSLLYSSPSSSYLSVPSYKSSRQRSSSYTNIYTPTPSLYQNATSTSRSNSNSRLIDTPSRSSHTSYTRSPLVSSSSSSKIDTLSSRYRDSSAKPSSSSSTNHSRYSGDSCRTSSSSKRASRDYSQLYEDAKKELDSLTEQLNEQENVWNKEKQSLESKIKEMTEEAKFLPELEEENKKLKDEHKTLLRVLSKLNKDYTYTAQ